MKILNSLSSDWINSHPVFYNTKTFKTSTNINDVVEWHNFEFDKEGLYNYLKFGYLVFEKTVFKNVLRLRHSSVINITEENGVRGYEIIEGEDAVLKKLDGKKTGDECINMIKDHVNAFEKKIGDGRILLPLSGGHDSRLLFSFVEDKSKIDAITYDVSMSMKYSHESACAFALTCQSEVNWKNILVNNYFTKHYAEKNFNTFGLEKPIHASYHFEMYDQATKLFDTSRSTILSGSVGDWWSGEKVQLARLENWQDAEKLFFNHNISIPKEFIEVKADESYNESIIAPQLNLLKESDVYRTVFSRRGRMGLSGYIMRTAEAYLPTYTPFYDIDLATSQLHLSSEDRQNRMWQKNYFDSIGMGVGITTDLNISYSTDYSQDLQAMSYALSKDLLINLNEKELGEFVSKKRIQWINSKLEELKKIPVEFIAYTSNSLYSLDNNQNPHGKSGPLFEKIYSSSFNIGEINKAIVEWSVLAPLQMAINRRNK